MPSGGGYVFFLLVRFIEQSGLAQRSAAAVHFSLVDECDGRIAVAVGVEVAVFARAERNADVANR